MQRFRLSPKSRRVLLWILPALAILSFVFCTTVPKTLQNQYQAIAQDGWTTWLENQPRTTVGHERQGTRQGDLAVDPEGRVWVAGGMILGGGLHYLDNTIWDSRGGVYHDLAIEPSGRVWATHHPDDSRSDVDVFDEGIWITYEGSDFGIDDQQILQVEISTDGRIWISSKDSWTKRISEIVRREDGTYAVESNQSIVIKSGQIKSLDADKQGNMWAAIWNYKDVGEQWPSGLYKFDGNTWQRVPDQGMDLQRVVRISFGDEGDAWIVTNKGEVLRFDGKSWSTIVEANRSPLGASHDGEIGLYIDGQDRLWLWQEWQTTMHVLNNGKWSKFSVVNSSPRIYAPCFRKVFGTVFDDHDQLWVASVLGVSMIQFSDAEQLPDIIARQYQPLSLLEENGLNWFIPAILLVLWIAVYQKSLAGVVMAITGATIIFFTAPPIINEPCFGTYLNPFVIVMFCGMIGALIGGQIDKIRRPQGSSKFSFGIVLAVAGLIIGIPLMGLYMLAISP